VRVPRAALEQLLAKYAQMLAMRIAHASGEEEGGQVRRRMAELAARFPGALREMDELELAEIRRRIEVVEGVLYEHREVEAWMEAMALFHAMARGALSAKRWLRGRKTIDAAVERAFAEGVPWLPFPEDARAWTGHLARLAAPPRGRVTDLVFARVAESLGTTEAAARRLVFGVSRRERQGNGTLR
jgi:hypothetical protein